MRANFACSSTRRLEQTAGVATAALTAVVAASLTVPLIICLSGTNTTLE